MSGEEDTQTVEGVLSPGFDMTTINTPDSLDLDLNTESTLDPLTVHEEANLDPKPEETSLDHTLPTEGNVCLSLDNLGLETTIANGEILDPNCDDSNVDIVPGEVSPGSIASTGLAVGDVILRVGEAETSSLTHNQCQNHLQAAGNLLQLQIAKGGSASPSVTSPQPDQYATRLNQQLAAGMDNYPTSPGHFPDVQPDYNNYNDYNNADNDYNNADNGYSSAPKAPPLPSPQANYRSQPTPPPYAAMPDKVLNMAAKGGPDKKPFSYVPDADALKEHRDRVRRRKPSGPDITQSATYKLIHGLDEPPPTTPTTGRRPTEGTQPTHACAQASTCDVINNNGDVCDTNGQSQGPTPTSTNHPISLQPAVSGMYPGRSSTRQGLSFMVLQYLYDNDSNQDVTSHGSDSGQVTSDSGHVTSEMTSESASTSPGSSSVPSTPGSLSPTSPHNSRHSSYRKRGQRPVRQPSQDDELSFSGVGRDAAYDHIPSRAFHKLQSLTGGSEVDRSSIRGNVAGVSAKPTRRNLRRAESAPHYQEDDDRDGGVDLSYVGASIPSRSFRMLQQSIGADPSDYDAGVTNGMQDPLMVGPSDGSQPTPEAQARAARERRRRRRRGSLPRQVSSSPIRRPVLPREQPHEARPSDFDEEAYLAGRVPIVRSEDEIQARPLVTRSRSRPMEPDDEIPPENLREFDEKAFLAGQVSIMGDPADSCNLPPRVPKKKEFSVRPDWAHTVQRKKRDRAFERSTSQVANDRLREQEKSNMRYITLEDDTPQRDFDEKAYLHGQVPIFDEQPKAPRPMMKEAASSKQPYEFQMIAQRRASIDFQDPLKRAMEEAERLKVEQEEAKNQEPFDEKAFLQGRMPGLVSVPDKVIPKEIPAWVKKAPQADPDVFEERAYLGGRIPLIGEGTPGMRPVSRPRKKKPKPEPEPEDDNREPFDESAFLAGQVPILGGAVDPSAPPRQPRKKVEKTFAPWERQDTSEDLPDENAGEFDERQFLQGRVPVVRGPAERDVRAPRQDPGNANQRIPSKTFIRLSRSVSRDGVADASDFDRSRSLSPGEARRRQMELQLGTTKDVPIEDMKYKGTNIPSKSFARLQSQISKSGGDEPPPDPLERLRNKQPEGNYDGYIDPEKALEVMQIREHSPEKFFDALENVATGGSGKPQVNGEVKAAEPPRQVKAAEPPKQVKAAEPPKQVTPKSPSTGGIKVISRSISQDAKQQQPPPMQQPAQQQQQKQQQQQQQQQQPPPPPPPPQPQQQQVDQANFDEADDQVTDF